MLTGLKNTDTEILQLLKDKDLIAVCLVSKGFNELCKDENFWMNRFIKKYPTFYELGLKPKNMPYRKYYLDLTKRISKIFEDAKRGYVEFSKIGDDSGEYLLYPYVKNQIFLHHIVAYNYGADLIKFFDSKGFDVSSLFYTSLNPHVGKVDLELVDFLLKKGGYKIENVVKHLKESKLYDRNNSLGRYLSDKRGEIWRKERI